MTTDLSVERALIGAYAARRLLAVDEVGRGALAGPVVVGLCAVTAATPDPPPGVEDSKVLSPARRRALAPRLAEWAEVRLGEAPADEVDALGVLGALALALARAAARLEVAPGPDDVLLLDGNVDWALDAGLAVPVVTRVRADRTCAAVAAASIVAKVHRDELMARLDDLHPGYGWARNAGYGTPEHRRAIAALGPTALHRRTWRLLPG